MSAEIKLQAGQWYRDGQGDIVYCIGFNPCQDTTIRNYSWMCCTKDTHVRYYTGSGKFDQLKQCLKDIIEHLPDCTGFDWVPPKPVSAPEGYRLLTHGEEIDQDDLWWDTREWRSLIGNRSAAGESWDVNSHCPVARKIEPPQPKYRPFKDGAEFKTHRDEWFCDAVNTSFRVKVTAYDSEHVWFAGCSVGQRYAEAFKHRKREDGSPFGVLDDGT